MRQKVRFDIRLEDEIRDELILRLRENLVQIREMMSNPSLMFGRRNVWLRPMLPLLGH